MVVYLETRVVSIKVEGEEGGEKEDVAPPTQPSLI